MQTPADLNNKQVKLTKGDIRNMYIRSWFLLGSFNFERAQNMGYCFTMIPAIKRLYKPGKERNEALVRHMEWFNTHPWLTAPIFGVTAAMEEEKANGGNIDGTAIAAMKIGLMEPLAGVGDPLFWGTARPVLAALGARIAMTGSILGPLLFFVLINAIRLTMKWYFLRYGYVKGALVSKWTTINIPIVATKINGKTQTVQDILDSVMPGMLALLLTLFVSWLLKKGVNPMLIIVAIFALGILGKWLGFLG